MVVAKGCGREGEMGCWYLMGTQFMFGKMRKFWRWMLVIVAQQCGYAIELYALE